jgi:hypothetical protein
VLDTGESSLFNWIPAGLYPLIDPLVRLIDPEESVTLMGIRPKDLQTPAIRTIRTAVTKTAKVLENSFRIQKITTFPLSLSLGTFLPMFGLLLASRNETWSSVFFLTSYLRIFK